MFKYVGFVSRAGLRVVSSYPWIKRYAKHPEKYDISKRYSKVHIFLKKCVRNFKVEFFLEGLENLKSDSNFVLIPNHQSNMDPLSLLAICENPISFISKKEAEKFPIVGNVIKDIDGMFIDRSNLKQEVRAIMKLSKSLEENRELSYVVFPEGTRSRDPNHLVQEFKPGSLKMAYNSKTSILPVALYGTFRVLDKKMNMKKFPIQVKFLKPIPYEEYSKYTTVEFAKILHDLIEKEVEILRQKDKELCKKYCYKRRKNHNYDISGL